jgi:hypothetical protein
MAAGAASISEIDVYWSGSGSDTTYYYLERSADGSAWGTIATLPVSCAAYADIGLAAGSTYYYRARGYNGSAFGSVNATTKTATTDNAVTRFDGTAFVVQSSLATLDDAGAMTVQSLVVAAGTVSSNTLTGETDTPTVDPGWTSSSTVDMYAPDGYIKMLAGTQVIVIPFWNT